MSPPTMAHKLSQIRGKIKQLFCRHEWEPILMPHDWERLYGLMTCEKCWKNIEIAVVIDKTSNLNKDNE